MEKIVITIHPPNTDEGLLRVSDAMEQVLDMLRLHDAARSGVLRPEGLFEWRLERAATNSPFTITARAESRDPAIDVTEYVQLVNREFRTGFENLTMRGIPASWMDPEALGVAAAILKRNQNGIGLTTFKADEDKEPLVVDRRVATEGMKNISAVDVLSVEASAEESVAWGELRGVMVNAGLWGKKPALRLLTPDYGLVWCRLLPEVAEAFGHERTLDESWKGEALAVEGKLIYKAGGRIARVIVSGVRDLPEVPRVDLDSIIDRDFTGGLDPVEYLRRLHEGELA